MLDKVLVLGQKACKDHTHDYVALSIKEPANDQAKVFHHLLRQVCRRKPRSPSGSRFSDQARLASPSIRDFPPQNQSFVLNNPSSRINSRVPDGFPAMQPKRASTTAPSYNNGVGWPTRIRCGNSSVGPTTWWESAAWRSDVDSGRRTKSINVYRMGLGRRSTQPGPLRHKPYKTYIILRTIAAPRHTIRGSTPRGISRFNVRVEDRDYRST